MADKAQCHEALKKFGQYGTIYFVGTGKDYEVIERQITKVRDLPPEQKRLIEQLVFAMKCTTIKVISVPTRAGNLAPDRVELMWVR